MAFQSMWEVASNTLQLGETWIWCDAGPLDENDFIELTYANHPDGLVPFGTVRPSSGTFMGYQQGGTEFDPGVSIQFDPTGFSTGPRQAYINTEAVKVTAQLNWDGRREVKRLLELPGPQTGSSSYFGGETEFDQHNLVLINLNRFKPNVIEVIVLWTGIFEPMKRILGGISEHNPLPMTFYSLAADDPDNATCLRPPGERNGRIYYVRADTVDVDGVTLVPTLINPDTVLAGEIIE